MGSFLIVRQISYNLINNVAVNQRQLLSGFGNLINANISLIYANIKEFS